MLFRSDIILEEKIEYWLDQMNVETSCLPADIVAFNFGLFETENGYGIYLIGSKSYDEQDDDWACDIDFEPEDKYGSSDISSDATVM